MTSYEARFFYAFPNEKLSCVGRNYGISDYSLQEIVTGQADPLVEYLHQQLSKTQLGLTKFCMLNEDVKTAVIFNYDNRLRKLIINIWAGLSKPKIRILNKYPFNDGWRFDLSQGCQFLVDSTGFLLLLVNNYPRIELQANQCLNFEINQVQMNLPPFADGSIKTTDEVYSTEYLQVEVEIIFYDNHISFLVPKRKWLDNQLINLEDIN